MIKMDKADDKNPMTFLPFASSPEATVKILDTDFKHGLAGRDAPVRLEKFGPNKLQDAAREPWAVKLFRQFKSVVILILLIAAVISGVMGEWFETWAILAIVLLNGGIGFLQEARAEQALASLRKLSAPQSRVVRDGRLQSIPASQLVPGDLIELEAGDFVPADARLGESFGLRIQEAALTGESEPVDKRAKEILARETALADRINMIYMGTTVLAGKANAVVVATGMDTELGHIAKLLQSHIPELTPLQRRLEELGRILIVLCLSIVALIVVLHWLRGGELHSIFIFAVSLAVAVIPEGLPAVVTIALALGLTRMAARNALIRRLPSVETLGSVTVICSDKTGTLTRNEMTVRKMFVGSKEYDISGSGYAPKGDFIVVDGTNPKLSINPQKDTDLMLALTIGARCNHASVAPDKDNPGIWTVIGDPTEGALVVAALKADVSANSHDEPFMFMLPFDSERRLMSVGVRDGAGIPLMMTKGAPEAVLSRSQEELWNGTVRPLTDARRQAILDQSQQFAAKAFRMLGLAFRTINGEYDRLEEQRLIFVGLAGMLDPPREEAKLAVDKCKSAGIRPVMITGDHPSTARAIAQELGIATEDDQVVSGHDLDQWTGPELEEKIMKIAVYARVTAEHKLRVVQAWKRRGAIVAMTGDGVNDAPAVEAADIGIAMGITGTDVTKEASAMVLADDNFASIVNAVEEGRGILDNIQNIIHFLLAGNISEIILVLSAVLVGWPIPLSPIQILWINLITDGFPALALATERPEKGIMNRKPRPVKEPLFTWQRGLKILQHGAILSAVVVAGFWWALYHNPTTRGNIAQAQAVVFCICCFAQLSFSFACRSRRYTFPELGARSNLVLLFAVIFSVILQFVIVVTPVVHPFSSARLQISA